MAVMLTLEDLHYAFTNTLSEEESAVVYERYAVPGPGRVLFQAALVNFYPRAATKVDFHNDGRAPPQIIDGDRITTPRRRSTGLPLSIRASRSKHGLKGVPRLLALHTVP
jgi:hypothetical protein